MRRGPERKRIEQEPKLFLRLFLGDTHHLKHAFLHVTAVNTDRTAADFVAVAHNVVGVRQGTTRIGIEGVEAFVRGGGKCVVHRRPGGMAQGHIAGSLGLGGGFEHGCVNHPGERPITFLDEAKLASDLAPGCPQEGAGRLGFAGGEENAVARLRPHVCGNAVPFRIGQVFRHRAAGFAVFPNQNVGQALRAPLFRPFLPGIQLPARLGGTPGHDYGTHVFVLEHPERGVAKELGALHQFDVEPQVGLVGTIVPHSLRIGHAGNRGGDGVTDQLPQGDQDFFHNGDDVFLVDKAHFHVELHEFGLPVGPEVLIPIAASQLVVAFHAGHHEQLFKQLGGLRQGVPGAGLEPGRHHKVAGSLRGGAGQGGGFDLHKIMLFQHPARRLIGFRTQPEGAALDGSA